MNADLDHRSPRSIRILIAATWLLANCALMPQEPEALPVERAAFLPDISYSGAGATFERICLDAFHRVVTHVATTRGTVSVEFIDGSPLTNSRTPIDVRFTVAEQFAGNPVYEGPILDGQVETAMSDMKRLLEAGPATPGTDVLAALRLAERILTRPRLGEAPERRSLIVCGDALNTTQPMNFYKQVPTKEETEDAINSMRDPGTLPLGLAGVNVYLVGVGQPTTGRITVRQAEAAVSFFRALFEAVNAHVVMVGATLPHFP